MFHFDGADHWPQSWMDAESSRTDWSWCSFQLIFRNISLGPQTLRYFLLLLRGSETINHGKNVLIYRHCLGTQCHKTMLAWNKCVSQLHSSTAKKAADQGHVLFKSRVCVITDRTHLIQVCRMEDLKWEKKELFHPTGLVLDAFGLDKSSAPLTS